MLILGEPGYGWIAVGMMARDVAKTQVEGALVRAAVASGGAGAVACPGPLPARRSRVLGVTAGVRRPGMSTSSPLAAEEGESS